MNDILNKIPCSWDELTLQQYINLNQLQTEITNDLDTNLNVISKVTGLSIDEVEELPLNVILPAINKLSFLSEQPEFNKTTIRIKTIDGDGEEAFTYNDFITFQSLKEEGLNNIIPLIQVLSIDKLTEEDLLKMNAVSVLSAFFLAFKQIKKSLIVLHTSLVWKMIKNKLKEKIRMILNYLFHPYRKIK